MRWWRTPSFASTAAPMLYWAIVFFIVSLVAGAYGFTAVAQGARIVAFVLFGLFLTAAFVAFLIAWGLVSLVT